MKRLLSLLIATTMLFTIAFQFGCAGKSAQTSTKAFVAAQGTMLEIFRAADRSCSAGILNQTQCDKISSAYNKAKSSYNAAATAMQAAIRAGEAGKDATSAWEKFKVLEGQFDLVYNDLIDIAITLGVEYTQ